MRGHSEVVRASYQGEGYAIAHSQGEPCELATDTHSFLGINESPNRYGVRTSVPGHLRNDRFRCHHQAETRFDVQERILERGKNL